MSKADHFKLEKKRQILASKGKIEELKKLYSKNLPEIKDLNTNKFWDKRIDNKTKYTPYDGMTKDRIEAAYNFLPKSAKKIFDIGAGYGYLEDLISKNKKVEIFGNDISENAIFNLNKRFDGKFKKESIYKMKYKNNSFDAVFMLEVLEHVPPSKVFEILKKVKSMLKKRGNFIISIPVNEGISEMKSNPNGHLRDFTEELIKAELKIAGFKPLEIKKFYAFNSNYIVKKKLSKILKNRWKPNDLVIKAISI